jgi:hypothetical protein
MTDNWDNQARILYSIKMENNYTNHLTYMFA